MHRSALLPLSLGFLLPFSIASSGQAPSRENSQSGGPQNDLTPATLRVTTREVLVDLIALDRHNKPVLDLKPVELQVSESAALITGEKTKKNKRTHRKNAADSIAPITSLSIFDPNGSPSSPSDARTGFRILASCLERTTVHYLLAFHPGPDGWTSGHHQIAISTNRAGTRLFYRHEYYVGLAAPSPDALAIKQERIDQVLQQSACYYPVAPLSIALQARFVDAGHAGVAHYLVSVDTSSLSLLTLNNTSTEKHTAGFDRRVELDYGICNFDESGHPVSYFHSPLERILTSADYARALDRGFPHVFEFPLSANIALTRVVLRDRATGNMGAADVAIQFPEHGPVLKGSPAEARTAADLQTYQDQLKFNWERDGNKRPSVWIPPVKGPIGSFGSIVPAPHSFCGDVYELPEATRELPDFRGLDPIGALYTSSLDVPNQTFSNTSGIPGVTPRTNLFGIDYHASFWVRIPGLYQFLLASDDGAILRIDDRKVIDLNGIHSVNAAMGRLNLDAGSHTIHVPYYQGAVDSVALELWVKPPDSTQWVLFKLDDFAAP